MFARTVRVSSLSPEKITGLYWSNVRDFTIESYHILSRFWKISMFEQQMSQIISQTQLKKNYWTKAHLKFNSLEYGDFIPVILIRGLGLCLQNKLEISCAFKIFQKAKIKTLNMESKNNSNCNEIAKTMSCSTDSNGSNTCRATPMLHSSVGRSRSGRG